MSDRLTQLQRMLEKQPDDPFLLYGIAMEFKKLKDYSRALEFLEKTLAADAGYCYAYFQKGQVLELTGDIPGARSAYQSGIQAASRSGDAHAQSELQGAMGMLG